MSQRTIVAVTICIMFILVGCANNTNKLHDTIKGVGYTPIALPSTAYQPGKVVYIIENDPFQASTVCEYGSYIGSSLAAKDEATSLAASEKLTNTFTLGADFIKQINGNLGYSSIKDIKVTLTNVSVEEIPDNIVLRGLSSQSPDCTQAIRKQDRDHIGFLQNALKADATYDITFDQKVDTNTTTQQELLRGLAVKLGGQYTHEGNNQIRGNNLYWGVAPPRKDLVLTPFRIAELQLLDEKFVDRTGLTPVLLGLHPRPSTTFHYKNEDDLLVAILFTIEDFEVDKNLSIDIVGTISIQTSEGRELAKISLLPFTNVHTWERMPIIEKVGVEKVRKYLNLPIGSMAYIAIGHKFKPSEIPVGGGNVEISITDNISKFSSVRLTYKFPSQC